MKNFLFFFSIFLILINPAFSQEEDSGTKMKFSGSFRTRGFGLGRDILLERQTLTTPIYDKEKEVQSNNEKINQTIQKEIDQLKLGKPSTLTRQKENLSFYDSRFLFNLNFSTSKFVEGLWGMQVGDINFGGRGLPTPGPGGYDPNIVGPRSGGERGSDSVNVQTNFLMMNFKLPEYGFQTRVGLQLFSSVGGRVLFSTGTGINMIKSFQFLRLGWEGGLLRARERSLIDSDNNGFADKRYQKTNIFFSRLKMDYFRNYKTEIYTYGLSDKDNTDNEIGELYWNGFYNEFNYSKISFVLHGVYNSGVVRQFRPINDVSGSPVYYKYNRNFVKGGLYDISLAYRFNETNSASLVALGTTGRPGFEKDGTSASLRGNGYKPLAPGYAISNIAVDFTGGYALFNAQTMAGLNNYGANYTFLLFNLYQLTLGYYQVYSSLSPKLENNRNFNFENGYRTSTYFGQEYNLNLRWNIYRDLQFIFRSGYFIAGDGLFAYLDTRQGSIIREAFFTLEHRF